MALLILIKKFQSSPGPRAGSNGAGWVSVDAASNVFQSSPGPRAGSNQILPLQQTLPRGFQSSPGPRAGSNLRIALRKASQGTGVSILSRPASREQRLLCGHDHAGGFRFQSSPGPRAGSNLERRGSSVGIAIDVSILSRPASREQRAHIALQPNERQCGFNPLPAREPGATTCWR